MRFTDQYLWNLAFAIFFFGVVVAAAIMLDARTAPALYAMTPMEFLLLSLAAFRVTRLFVYDKITAFFREQFFDLPMGEGDALVRPGRGPRRTLADLLTCPWCFGMWSAAVVVFFYFISPIFWYPILFLAVAGAGTLFQIFANMLGWRAEVFKRRAGN